MQLLISVMLPDEVPAAVAGGADIIDIKNPAEGALGAARPEIIRQVRGATPRQLPVSAALGDAPHLPGLLAQAALGAAGCGVQYVKVGLLGSRQPEQAIELLGAIRRAVDLHDPAVGVIACGYADAPLINSLPPADLPAVAAAAGADGCLLDTYHKGQGNLLHHLTCEQLRDWLDQCRQRELLCALAGSLAAADLPAIVALAPDIVGVRGAACAGSRRDGRIDAERVRHLKRLLAGSASPASHRA